jgi:Fe2+ transport system protein FeoA
MRAPIALFKTVRLWDNQEQFLFAQLPMTTVRLSTLKPGEYATIAALHTDEALYHRLAAMGFRIGKRIDLVRRAKFAGPLHVRIGTTDIMLRRSDAQHIDVTPAETPE